ncbi:hypothetical protein D1822_00680 [Phaeobacter inhibens]|nr:DUF6525 family protein [Phaeobacter inhibens]AXT21434.1 hypothetical protein D1822_00680 [Phaeobacter inhibens]AXT44324.1 hypothetical protein D1821_15270 [Phaeobacter inhibens]MDO6758481.1 DUF6525 family protein [Phaeobacter inhibens]UWR50964.1 hypothetical protein K4F87_15425 [Phaeobacter inhibens]UWR58303.1 hypothetical protein K4F89_07685 [Phaeobacter inhibens]
MTGNCGQTSLKRKPRRGNPMQDYDCLPPDLRRWISSAVLPWSAKSVHRTFNKALARTGDRTHAFGELNRIQRKLTAKDAQKIWGSSHPDAVSSKR